MADYTGKTYIPFLDFPATKRPSEIEAKDKFLSQVNTLIERQLKLKASQKGVISYLLSEITDNITEHAETDRGFAFVQFFKNKGFVDITIADLGITIKGGYEKAGIEVESHYEALTKAINGVSSKEEALQRNERGFGLDTSHNIVLNGLGQGAKFYLISGNGMIVDRDKGIEFDESFAWPGTLLFIRIPKIPENFSLIPYTSA